MEPKGEEPQGAAEAKAPHRWVFLPQPKRLMQKLYRITSKNVMYPELCGVHLEPGWAMAADGHRLAGSRFRCINRIVATPFHYTGERLDLPNELVKVLAQQIDMKDDAEVAVTEDRVGIRCTVRGEPFERFVDRPKGQFPDWRLIRMIRPVKAWIKVEPRGLVESVKRCKAALYKDNPLAIATDGRSAVMVGKTKGLASCTEELGQAVHGEPCKVLLKPDDLLDALAMLDKRVDIYISGEYDYVRLCDGDTEAAVLSTTLESDEYDYLTPAAPECREGEDAKAD